jgi:hypothetical protein
LVLSVISQHYWLRRSLRGADSEEV